VSRWVAYFIFLFSFIGKIIAQPSGLDDFFLKRGHASLSIGATLPLFGFANENATEASSSCAKNGYHYRFDLGYETGRMIGFIGTWVQATVPFNDDAFANYFKQNLPYWKIGPAQPFSHVSSNPYSLQALSMGAFVPLRIADATYEFKLQAGLVNLTRPAQDVIYLTPANSTYTLKIDASESTAFLIQAGVGARYRIFKGLLFKGSAEYGYAELKFKDVILHDIPANSGYFFFREGTTYVHMINVSAGLCFQFR